MGLRLKCNLTLTRLWLPYLFQKTFTSPWFSWFIFSLPGLCSLWFFRLCLGEFGFFVLFSFVGTFLAARPLCHEQYDTIRYDRRSRRKAQREGETENRTGRGGGSTN